MSGEGSGSARGTEKQKEEEEKIEEDFALRRRSWTREEDAKLSQMVAMHGDRHWSVISPEIPGRSDSSCRNRWFYKLSPNVILNVQKIKQMSGEGSASAQGTEKEKEEEEKIEEDIALRIKPWTREEDDKLSQMVELHESNWTVISSEMPGRSVQSCRQRWWRQLTPKGERRLFTAEEDDIILRARLEHGNDWATIAKLLPGRTSISIQNHWYSNLRWRKRDAEGSQQQQQDLSFVGTSASSSSNSEIDILERKRLCQREDEDEETPEMAWAMSLLEPDPITSLSPRSPGSGGDGGGSGGEDKKE